MSWIACRSHAATLIVACADRDSKDETLVAVTATAEEERRLEIRVHMY